MFVPFNTDSFGMSDLESAHKLEKKVKTKNFNINYSEMAFDSLRDFMIHESFDKAICMRLHACVFAHFFDIPTFRLEYSDYSGKVHQFCSEFGLPCFPSILEFETTSLSGWLNENYTGS